MRKRTFKKTTRWICGAVILSLWLSCLFGVSIAERGGFFSLTYKSNGISSGEYSFADDQYDYAITSKYAWDVSANETNNIIALQYLGMIARYDNSEISDFSTVYNRDENAFCHSTCPASLQSAERYGNIVLHWRPDQRFSNSDFDTTSSVVNYRIDRKEGELGDWAAITTGWTGTEYEDSNNLVAGSIYYYRVFSLTADEDTLEYSWIREQPYTDVSTFAEALVSVKSITESVGAPYDIVVDTTIISVVDRTLVIDVRALGLTESELFLEIDEKPVSGADATREIDDLQTDITVTNVGGEWRFERTFTNRESYLGGYPFRFKIKFREGGECWVPVPSTVLSGFDNRVYLTNMYNTTINNRVHNGHYKSYYLVMDNGTVIDTKIAEYETMKIENGGPPYGGIMFDDTYCPMKRWYLDVYPKAYTDSAWQESIETFLDTMMAEYPDDDIVTNGFGAEAAADTVDETLTLLTHSDGGELEHFGWSKKGAARNDNWYKQMLIVTAVQDTAIYDGDKLFLNSTGVDGSNHNARIYAYASYLVVEDDRTYYSSSNESGYTNYRFYPEMQIHLGNPTIPPEPQDFRNQTGAFPPEPDDVLNESTTWSQSKGYMCYYLEYDLGYVAINVDDTQENITNSEIDTLLYPYMLVIDNDETLNDGGTISTLPRTAEYTLPKYSAAIFVEQPLRSPSISAANSLLAGDRETNIARLNVDTWYGGAPSEVIAYPHVAEMESCLTIEPNGSALYSFTGEYLEPGVVTIPVYVTDTSGLSFYGDWEIPVYEGTLDVDIAKWAEWPLEYPGTEPQQIKIEVLSGGEMFEFGSFKVDIAPLYLLEDAAWNPCTDVGGVEGGWMFTSLPFGWFREIPIGEYKLALDGAYNGSILPDSSSVRILVIPEIRVIGIAATFESPVIADSLIMQHVVVAVDSTSAVDSLLCDISNLTGESEPRWVNCNDAQQGNDLDPGDGLFTSASFNGVTVSPGDYKVFVKAIASTGDVIAARRVSITVIEWPPQKFVNKSQKLIEAAESALYTGEPYASVTFDANDDGLTDLAITQRDEPFVLYIISSIEDSIPVLLKAEYAFPGISLSDYRGIAVADYHREPGESGQSIDIFLAHQTESCIYKSEPDTLLYEKVSIPDLTQAFCGAWEDYDKDGNYDLFIGKSSVDILVSTKSGGKSSGVLQTLLHNLGDGEFENVVSLIPGDDNHMMSNTVSALWLNVYDTQEDINDNLQYPDLVITDYALGATSGGVRVFINRGIDSTSTRVLVDETDDWIPNSPAPVVTLNKIDHAQNGDFMDLVLGRISPDEPGNHVFIYENTGGSFQAVDMNISNMREIVDIIVYDHNHDLSQDILLLSQLPWMAPQVLLADNNSGEKRYIDIGENSGLDVGAALCGVVANFNGVRGHDLFLGRPTTDPQHHGFYFNGEDFGGDPSHVQANWVEIELYNATATRDACIGAKVLVEAGGETELRYIDGGCGRGSQGTSQLEFGLGDYTGSTVTATIMWPNGDVQQVTCPVNTTTQIGPIPEIDDSSVSFHYQPGPGGTDWVFEWETSSAGFENQDSVTLTSNYIEGQPCFCGYDQILIPSMGSVDLDVERQSGGGYKHTLTWHDGCCVPRARCNYQYQVSSGNAWATRQSSIKTAERFITCVSP